MSDVQIPVPDGARVEVIKNLRDGDVIWICVPAGTTEEETEAIHVAVAEGITAEVAIFVAPDSLVESVSVLPLDRLIALRDLLDQLIDGQAQSASGDS